MDRRQHAPVPATKMGNREFIWSGLINTFLGRLDHLIWYWSRSQILLQDYWKWLSFSIFDLSLLFCVASMQIQQIFNCMKSLIIFIQHLDLPSTKLDPDQLEKNNNLIAMRCLKILELMVVSDVKHLLLHAGDRSVERIYNTITP